MIYQSLWRHDSRLEQEYGPVAGIDEVGRGPLAGNVVAACVILDPGRPIPHLRDSKKVTERRREALYDLIHSQALFVGVGECSPGEIDNINILQATFIAMKRAIQNSGGNPELILVDGNKTIPGLDGKQRCLVKGDGLSASIAAASIIAKVTRDRQMRKLDDRYPHYGFRFHKGYGSARHIAAILEHGMTPEHRKSFKPKALLQPDLFQT